MSEALPLSESQEAAEYLLHLMQGNGITVPAEIQGEIEGIRDRLLGSEETEEEAEAQHMTIDDLIAMLEGKEVGDDFEAVAVQIGFRMEVYELLGDRLMELVMPLIEGGTLFQLLDLEPLELTKEVAEQMREMMAKDPKEVWIDMMKHEPFGAIAAAVVSAALIGGGIAIATESRNVAIVTVIVTLLIEILIMEISSKTAYERARDRVRNGPIPIDDAFDFHGTLYINKVRKKRERIWFEKLIDGGLNERINRYRNDAHRATDGAELDTEILKTLLLARKYLEQECADAMGAGEFEPKETQLEQPEDWPAYIAAKREVESALNGGESAHKPARQGTTHRTDETRPTRQRPKELA